MIADGCASDSRRPEECALKDEWKTARLNDQLAVGFAGHVDYGNQIMCRLFGRRDLQSQRGNIRVVRAFEAEGLELPTAKWHETKRALTDLMQELKVGISRQRPSDPTVVPMDLTMMMAGSNDGEPSICLWHAQYQWQPVEVGPEVPGRRGATVCVGPGGRALAPHGVFEDPSRPLEDRAIVAIAHAAAASPGAVNEYTTVRRLSRKFVLEIYAAD